MRNIMYLSFAAFIFAMSGCSNETFEEGYGRTGNDILVATIPSVESRTYMDGASVKWSAGDKIGIFSQSNNSGSYANNEYTLASEAGTQSAEFSGSCEGEKKVAYYPYSKDVTYDGTKISYDMPVSYTYKSENPKDNNGAPMACLISKDAQNQVSFKNAGALIYIIVKNIPAGYTRAILTSQGTNAPDIAGNVEITFTAEGIPTLKTLTNSNVTEVSGTDNKVVTINFAVSDALQDLEFYFPIPVNTYPELNISVAGDNKNTLSIKTFRGDDGKGVVAERGVRLYATVAIDKVIGEVPTEVESVAKATEALKNSNAIVIADVPDSEKSPEIALPKKSNSENEAVSISFDKISASNEIAIKESSEGEGSSVAKTVRVAIPAVEAGGVSSEPSFKIELPASTVTLDAVDGKATYAKVTAKTADHTLIIKEGVTVKELVIAGGNVEVYGTVKNISLADGNSSETTVTSYGSGVVEKVGGNNTDKFNFKSEWDGVSVAEATPTDGKIYTAAQLAYYQSKEIPKATTGKDLPATMTGNVTLCADIDMKQQPWIGMVLGENAVFDGANHTISNIRVDNFVLSEQSKYTPNACVGLVAATKPGSQIKNITIDGFEVTGNGADAKWSGALVGYSYGTTSYENCHAKNVKIESNSADAYRIGGLIGFIGKMSGTDKAVTLKGCSASNVTIKGSFSIGGLVGTVQGSADRTFNNCDVDNIKLSVNENSSAKYGAFSSDFYGPKVWSGYMSKFIGDINLVGTVTIDSDCSVDASFTEENLKSFGYGDIADYTYAKDASQEVINAAVSAAKHYSLADATSPFIPAQVDGGTITVNSTTLVKGTDYNRFTLIRDTWDGTTKTQPQKEGNVYQIKSAAELAWFQSKQAPTSVTAASLPVTVDADAKLCVDINLNNKPWLGMVINGKTFDGGKHTISNLNMSQYLLNQQATIYTPEACIGLFAAVYGNAAIKDITLDRVTIEPSAEKSPKWVGSLVGYSKGTGTTYTNCIAKNVKILTKGTNSFRVGGLIGYIEKNKGTSDATATLTGCKVETANIAASFSYGGLVGSLYDSVTFTDCHTSNITLALNGDCTSNLGYVSKFIGDVANNTTHNRVIIFNNCSADLLTSQEQAALNFSAVASQQKKSGTYTPVSPFVGIVDVTNEMTIKVGDKTLVNGTDYNKYVE